MITTDRRSQTAVLFLFILCLLSAVCCRPSFAEDINVSTTFDKRTAQVGEEIHMTIRVSGGQGNIQAPRLPALNGFDTFYTGRSSQISFVNGQTSSNVEFSYVLVPKNAGRFTLSPIEVQVNAQRFVTDPIEINVSESSGTATSGYTSQNQPPAYQQPFPPSSQGMQGQVSDEPAPAFKPEDDNIFVRAWVDKTSAYPNEQILLTYALYTRYDTRYEGFEKEASLSGFWMEEFPMEREVLKETVRMNGKRYVKAEIKKVALFPTAPADYTIDPGTMKASIRQEPQQTSVFDEFFNDSFFQGGSFFARRENRLLKPPPIHIQVKPYPTNGKPESFQGATGNFRMNASVDKTTVKQNEPVIMKMVIEGEGNIETLNKPKIPELPDFKVYDSDTSSQLFKTGNVIGGRKNFEIVFIPTESGRARIPKMEFSYFNPATASYVRLSTPEFNLNVTPSDQQFKLPENLSQNQAIKKEIELVSKDIRTIKETLPDEKAGQWSSRILYGLGGLNALLTLAAILGFVQSRERQRFSKDDWLRRRKFAKSMAESRIRRLKKSPDLTSYFEEVEKILTKYLADKFNFSAHGITRYDMERQLSEKFGDQDPLTRELLSLYRFCDEARFGKAAVPEELKSKALQILRDTMNRVEKMRI